MIWCEEEEEQQVEQEEDNIDEHVDDLSGGMTVPLQQLLYSKIRWDFSKWESSILVPKQINPQGTLLMSCVCVASKYYEVSRLWALELNMVELSKN